ncbi:MAG: hypothetical protein ABH852_05550 [Methanobacteriota archaeon]
MRGQAAVEYLLIFSVALTLFASVTVVQLINPSSDAAGDTLYLSQARNAVDAIAGAINTVYANGRGAVKSVSLQIDRSWTLQLDNATNKLMITVGISTGSENVWDNLRYTIKKTQSISNIDAGTYTAIVEWPKNVNAQENIYDGALADKKIYIYINPSGG